MINIEERLKKFVTLNFMTHIILSGAIRFILIIYGIYHDSVFAVPYTDIDYKVFTDAARHLLNGKSPYDRHTYRYSPLLAFMLIPNLLVSPIYGKILFSIIDFFVALMIRKIVSFNCTMFLNYVSINKPLERICSKGGKSEETEYKLESDEAVGNYISFITNLSMIIWLYNPLTIAIATRGNCDSIACFLVLVSIYLIQCKHQHFLGGVILGLAIHFRLYPIFYSLTLYMFLSNYSYYQGLLSPNQNIAVEWRNTIFDKKYLRYMVPNKYQFNLVTGCLTSLFFLLGFFYHLYGDVFIYETYLYHFVRHDARHNFSVYFYLQYLTAFIKNVPVWQKVLVTLPQLVLILVLSVKYGLNKISLNFGLLIQTMVMVSYNTVLTSQYFVWILSILPLCLWQINFSLSKTFLWVTVWFLAQGAWLLPAYLLEFKGHNSFVFIWLQSVAFFCVNVAIMGRLIRNHQFISVKNSKRS